MKTALNNLKLSSFAVIAAFMLSFTTAPVTNDTNQTTETQLQFLGKVDNLPVFRLVLNNPATTEYTVTVREENGEVLFSEKLKGQKIARIYKLDTDNADQISGTTFEVTNKTAKTSTVYKISNYTSTVDNVVVAKL